MLLRVCLIFFKLGFVAFGGGYSMVALVEREVVEKYAILEKDRFVNVVSIAGGLPGAIGMNIAIFVGFLQGGFLGAVAAAFSSALPCLIIITLLMTLFSGVNSLPLVQSAMMGVTPVVVALVLYAAVRVGRSAYKTRWYMLLTVAGFLLSMFAKSIPLPYIVIGGLCCGILIDTIRRLIAGARASKGGGTSC